MKIPRKPSDIKVKTYKEYETFFNSLTDEQRKDENYFMKNTIKIFYDIDDDKYNKYTYQDVMDLFTIISNILEMKNELVRTFTIDGIEYGINPNFNDMTFAELVDCNTEDTIKQIAILYRPIIKRNNNKYIIKEYEADISHYEYLKEHLTMDVYNGFIGFFLNIQKGFILYTQKSLMEMDINHKKRNTLEKSGAGILSYMNYVEKTLLNKNMSLK